MPKNPKEIPEMRDDWISRTLWKLGVASRRTGMPKWEYFEKYRDDIIRHNHFP